MTKHDITVPDVESQFGTAEGKVRFARFCNAVIVAEAKGPLPSLPRLDDSPGPDGGFDGSWTLSDSPLAVHARPFAQIGWNAFQFKALGSESDPAKAFSRLKQSVTGAIQSLITRANRLKELRQYTLFTSLNLGRVEASSTATGALSSLRDELIAAIRAGLSSTESVHVELVSAAELQAIVNQRPALRETFFGDTVFDTWDQAWAAMALQPNTQPDSPLVGRAAPLTQLKAKLSDPAIGFIGIPGASGMGKTRLGLEATRDISAQTFFIRPGAKAGFLARRLEIYATPNRSFFVIEDLRLDEAKVLAQQAVLHPGICIIASIPAEEHLPRFGLGESPGIFSLRLPPLNSNESRELLQSVKAKLDRDAFEWIIQEAGGNPQILLVAAALGEDLRQKSGLLRKQVAQNFLAKAKALLGNEVEAVLELLSVLSPFDLRNEAHIDAVRSTMGLTVDSASLRHFRDRLVDAALAESSGRRGCELNISPPLLAAFLVERALEGHPRRCLTLYEKLDENGRRRLFDRLVSVDSPEGHGLWAFLFGTAGPFRDQSGIEDSQDSLRILARAAPRQTAEFLRGRSADLFALLSRKKLRTSDSLTDLLTDQRGHYQHNQRIDHFRSTVHTIVHELVDHPDSSRVALGLLEDIVTADQDHGNGFAKLFTECFVTWNYGFPVPPKERWPIVERLTRSPHPAARKAGFNALFHISDPPHNTGGQAVERRRMGKQAVRVTWAEIWDYHTLAFERHLTTASKAGPFRAVANERFAGALAELRRLPPNRTMPLLRRVERVFWRRAIALPPAHYLECLIDTRERFVEAWEKYRSAEWAAGIPAFNAELDAMMSRIERGSLALRLTIWIDRHPSFGWDEVPGTKLHRYEVELEKLAIETAAQPRSFTPRLANLLVSGRSTHGGEFAQRLGRADRAKRFWAKLKALQSRTGGAWVFGCYCEGVAEHDPTFVERALDQDMLEAGASMLMILKKLGPTTTNRRRLLDLLKRRRVTPGEVAGMFFSGRWLDDLPLAEVRAILSYIAHDRSAETTNALVEVFNLYLHPEKKVPRALLAFAETVLLRPARHAHNSDSYADNLAESVLNSSPSAAFRLFKRLMLGTASTDYAKRCWNPVSGLGSSMDFYRRIRTIRPALAYTTLFDYLTSRHRIDVLGQDTTLFDLESHSLVLLKLTKNEVVRAIAIARHLKPEQPGFWPFLYALLAQHPTETRVRDTLASIFINELPWGWLDDGMIDAGLQVVDRELAQASAPLHGRVFLEQIKSALAKRGASNQGDDES